MREIRTLTDTSLAAFVEITANAYPGIKIVTKEDKERAHERMASMQAGGGVHFYGLYEDGQMLGGMRFHDFTMKLHGTRTLVGGLGGVAVDLLRKKEKAARDMVQFFLHHYRDQGACLTALFPFRHDFYRRMGFGYGAKKAQYRVRPDSLPRTGKKTRVSALEASDKAALAACYDRYLDRTNGLMEKQAYALDGLFRSPRLKIVGVKEGDHVLGYLTFTFKMREVDNFLWQDIVVHELIYDDREALLSLLAFLRTQADQVDRIVFNVQDDDFHFLLTDPRNDTNHIIPSVWHESNTQGLGIMYRVIDVPRLFSVLREHSFGGQSCRLRLTLTDTFMRDNGGSYDVVFTNGRAAISATAEPEVEIKMDIAEFSSLIVGAVRFRSLHNYGLADISDEAYLATVHRLFMSEQKPLCMTGF